MTFAKCLICGKNVERFLPYVPRYCSRHIPTCKPPHGNTSLSLRLTFSERNYKSRHKLDYLEEIAKLERKIEILRLD